MDNNYYETSILEERLENKNKKELLNENIENYKNKLLSSYWTEINLTGYKIELLEKKVEFPKELEKRIVYIGNKISGIIEANKRHCFNCRDTQIIRWVKYLKGNYLCHACYQYNRRNDEKHGPMKFRLNARKPIPQDVNCFICGATKTSRWRRHSINEHYLCNTCGLKQQRINKKADEN
uniref:GATA-type domain-containing protein n=1 Tax=Meloidogyne incognita TaxID=6306 RepID=A0A914NWR6_MELIC